MTTRLLHLENENTTLTKSPPCEDYTVKLTHIKGTASLPSALLVLFACLDEVNNPQEKER